MRQDRARPVEAARRGTPSGRGANRVGRGLRARRAGGHGIDSVGSATVSPLPV